MLAQLRRWLLVSGGVDGVTRVWSLVGKYQAAAVSVTKGKASDDNDALDSLHNVRQLAVLHSLHTFRSDNGGVAAVAAHPSDTHLLLVCSLYFFFGVSGC